MNCVQLPATKPFTFFSSFIRSRLWRGEGGESINVYYIVKKNGKLVIH